VVVGIIAAFILLASSGAARADSQPALVVSQFYHWYLAHHGNVDWYAPQQGKIDWNLALRHHTAKYFQAKRFLHPDLFEGLDDNYAKSIGEPAPFYVSTMPEQSGARGSTFDPFVGASSPATSFRIGSPWSGKVSMGGAGPQYLRAVTLVPVSFTFADRSTRGVIVIVRKNGSRYQIYDVHYRALPFFYAGRIDDLQRFLRAYNC
jgi:hypothetical protein